MNWRERVYHPKSDKQIPDEWDDIRMSVMARDNWCCANCGKSGNLTVHHIIARANGGRNGMGNLTTLCNTCHDEVEMGINKPTKVKPENPSGDWHTWVYGGARNPLHSKGQTTENSESSVG